jgi:hypothetical protein
MATHRKQAPTRIFMEMRAPEISALARLWDEGDDRRRLGLEGLSFHDRQLALGAKDDRG